MGPWRSARFALAGLAAYRPYFKAYGPLVAYGLVSTALTTFDILIVSHVVSVEAVPAYKAALQYAMLLTTGVIFAKPDLRPADCDSPREKRPAHPAAAGAFLLPAGAGVFTRWPSRRCSRGRSCSNWPLERLAGKRGAWR